MALLWAYDLLGDLDRVASPRDDTRGHALDAARASRRARRRQDNDDLGSRIVARFAAIGGIELQLPRRGDPRQPPAAAASALGQFVDELRDAFGRRLVDVQLFGSRARGDGRDDSDVDVLVLVDGMTREERDRIMGIGADVSMAADGVLLSPLVRDADWLLRGSTLAREITADGVSVLYRHRGQRR